MAKAHLAPNDSMDSGQPFTSLFLVVNLLNKHDTGSNTPYSYLPYSKTQTSFRLLTPPCPPPPYMFPSLKTVMPNPVFHHRGLELIASLSDIPFQPWI